MTGHTMGIKMSQFKQVKYKELTTSRQKEFKMKSNKQCKVKPLPAPPAIIYITGVPGNPNWHTVPHQELRDNKVPVLKGFNE